MQKSVFTSHVIEGLDGSGKSTYAFAAANALTKKGVNCLVVHLPQYAPQFGSYIDKLLHTQNSEKELTIAERMALYALNRLEVLPFIEKEIKKFAKSDLPLQVIFDRSPWSNIVTCAYYMIKNGIPKDLYSVMKEYHNLMLELDAYFIHAMHIEEATISISMIHHTLSAAAMSADPKRTRGKDQYEVEDVQALVNELYGIVAKLNPQIVLYEQIKEDGVKVTPEEAGEIIISHMKTLYIPAIPKHEGILVALIVPGNLTRETVPFKVMESIFQKSGYERLKEVAETLYPEI